MRVSVRLVLLFAFVVVVCSGVTCVGAVLIGGRAPNTRLNPVEALAIRLTLLSRNKTLETAAGVDPKQEKFVIKRGDTANDIGFNLTAQGLITDADLFRNYVRFYGMDAKLQAGTYLLSKTQTIPQIAQALTNAGTNSVTVQVIEGWRTEQIAAAIDANPTLSFSGADFLALAGKGAQPPADFARAVGLPSGASLEGFLFPDTYSLPLDATANDLLTAMLNRFDTKVTAQMRTDAVRQGLTVYQAITLASIVEREAVIAEERPLIAGVYLNRLRKPMNLDADPTIQYALGNTRTAGTWWPNLTQEDYRSVQSLYNTYLHPGLPPTPIANPGLSSITAAINPQASNYFYFRASCANDGHHKFAVTFAEQQANGCS